MASAIVVYSRGLGVLALLCVTVRGGGESCTCLFNSPTSSWSRVSRASSLCPTSSNASVASCPATSRRTSSPPLRRHVISTATLKYFAEVNWGRSGRARIVIWRSVAAKKKKRKNLRMLVYELCAVVDLVVNHHVQILLGVMLRNILIGKLFRHFDLTGTTRLYRWIYKFLGDREGSSRKLSGQWRRNWTCRGSVGKLEDVEVSRSRRLDPSTCGEIER